MDFTKGPSFSSKPVSKEKKSSFVGKNNVVQHKPFDIPKPNETARSMRSKREPTPPPSAAAKSTKLGSKSKSERQASVKVSKSKAVAAFVKPVEKLSKEKRATPVAESKQSKSSNPFGFGIADAPVSKHVKTKTDLIMDTLRPVFIKKREAKAESKQAVPQLKKEVAKPDIKASKPMKFQKRDRSAKPVIGKLGSGSRPALSKPVDKSTSKFLGLLSGENPFLKPKKTLIATPSKFEIRTEPAKQTRGRGRPQGSKNVSDNKGKAGVRGKLDKVKKAAKSTDSKSKVPKMSAKSKRIEKEKIKKIIQKAKKNAKKDKFLKKKQELKAKKAEKALKKLDKI